MLHSLNSNSTGRPRCPACSSSNIIVDRKNGILVCRNCGLVIDEFIVEYTVQRSISLTAQAKPKTEPRYKYDVVNSHARLLSIRIKSRLVDLIGFENYLFKEFDSPYIEQIALLLQNECIKRIVKRLDRNERAAFLHIAYTMLENDYPLIAEISATYSIAYTRVRSLIRRARRCLSIPSTTSLIQF